MARQGFIVSCLDGTSSLSLQVGRRAAKPNARCWASQDKPRVGPTCGGACHDMHANASATSQRVAMNDGWVRVCARNELLPGEFKVVWDGDTAIAVYNLEGDLYAIEDTCTHDGGDLAGGEVCGY